MNSALKAGIVRPRSTSALLFVALLTAGCLRLTPPAPASPEPPRPESAVLPTPPPVTPCRVIVRIDIWKSRHMLRATCDDGGVLTMNVAIGRGPRAAKQKSGDRRTPEGRYAIAGPARESRFHLFIPIDYPSMPDADRGLADGLVDGSTHADILEAHAQGQLPPQDTQLGGDIGIHGEGEDWQGESRRSDWTLGCIAVTDAEIDRLAESLEAGVPVWIHP